MGLLIAFFCLSIFFSFLCSIWEAVLLSITPNYVRRKVAEKSAMGQQLKSYKEDIDRPLSAILTLNTIAHTIGAIGVGAQAGKVFGTDAEPILGLGAESWVAGIMTLAILILSEIIPKTIGANMWQELAPFTLKSLKILLFLLAPLVWVSQLITKSLKKEKGKSVLSRSDIHAMATMGENSGTLAKSESTIIKNLIQLERKVVQTIMTPRSVFFSSNGEGTVKEFFENNKTLAFSRIPIFDSTGEVISGMVLKDDILTQLAQGNNDVTLNSLILPIVKVKNTTPLPALFDQMVGDKIHLAAVIDNFGTVVGIVSMEDLLETILGLEITDESDLQEDMQELARKKMKANLDNS